MRNISFKKNKGYALLITVAILVVMTVMVITMTIATKFEAIMAQHSLDQTRVNLLINAAVERAVADIQYAADGPLYNSMDTLTETWYTAPPYTGSVSLGTGLTGTWYVDAIYDCSSMINIADGNPHLEQMLNNLNDYLGNPLAAADITSLVNNAPYETRQHVKRNLTGTEAEKETKFNAIQNYITAFSYIDENVVNPQDVSAPYALQPRAPVNINTAPKEVLVAVLNHIKAVNCCPRCGGDGYINGVYAGHYGCPACGGTWSPRVNGTGDLEIGESGDPNEASLLADYIITRRSATSFRTYDQLYATLKTCADIDERDADLILANANPNTNFAWSRNPAWYEDLGDVGKCVIDWNKDGSVTASDVGLITSTTEFSFNSGGYFELQVKGRITDSYGAIIAEKGAMVIVKVYDVYRESSQNTFESGALSNALTYPQPTAAGVSAATYSGAIGLDTKSYSTPSSGEYLRANYESTVSADAGGGTLTPINMAGEPTVGSVTNFSSRGDLMPDGVISDYFDSVKPKYWPANNVDCDAGSYIIWYKPLYPGNDTRAYGDNNQNRKMLRFTSDTQIPGEVGSNGWPFVTLWFWSDNNDLWSGAIRGGGRHDGSDWVSPMPNGWWWGWTNGGFPCWSKGEWQQLVVTWTNPDDFDPLTSPDYEDPTLYNTTNNPLKLYCNGSLLTTTTNYYHGPYGNSSSDRCVSVGCESDSWNGNANELSFAVIGSVRFFPSKLSDADIQADYINGIYQTSGSYSNTLSLPEAVTWGTLSWTEGIPSLGGNVTFNLDTGSGWQGTVDNVNIHAGTNGISNFVTTDESDTISYRANLSSSTNRDTSILENIFITYLKGHEIKFWRSQ
jgi:hypothetical protein